MGSMHKKIEETVVSSISPEVESVSTSVLADRELSRDDSRRQEEQKFLRRNRHVGPLEEVSDDRPAADDRGLGDVHTLLGDDDAANHERAAIGNGYLRLRRLRIE